MRVQIDKSVNKCIESRAKEIERVISINILNIVVLGDHNNINIPVTLSVLSEPELRQKVIKEEQDSLLPSKEEMLCCNLFLFNDNNSARMVENKEEEKTIEKVLVEEKK